MYTHSMSIQRPFPIKNLRREMGDKAMLTNVPSSRSSSKASCTPKKYWLSQYHIRGPIKTASPNSTEKDLAVRIQGDIMKKGVKAKFSQTIL